MPSFVRPSGAFRGRVSAGKASSSPWGSAMTLAREHVERLAERGIDIVYLHRTDRTGYKAGALDAGLKVAKGELVAVFDADFIPQPDFLRASYNFV